MPIVNYSSTLTNLSILKIGAYIGDCTNDNLYGKLNDKLSCIFVEPVERFIIHLKDYHRRTIPSNNFVYINAAVGKEEGKIKIYTPSNTNKFSNRDGWVYQLSGCNKTHFDDHGFTNIDLDEMWVPLTTVNKITEDYRVETIDYLSVDAEGCDYDIIRSIDFSKVKIKNISFEHLHMDGYKTCGDKYNNLVEYLKQNGFKLTVKNEMDSYFELDQ